MGMTRTGELFEKLSKSHDMETKILCEEAQNLYLAALRGNISTSEIKSTIEKKRLLERISEEHQEDYARLLELIAMIGSAQ